MKKYHVLNVMEHLDGANILAGKCIRGERAGTRTHKVNKALVKLAPDIRRSSHRWTFSRIPTAQNS